MEQDSELEKGKKIKIFLKQNNFVFSGTFLGYENDFLVLEDSRSGMKNMFNRTEVLQIEVLQ